MLLNKNESLEIISNQKKPIYLKAKYEKLEFQNMWKFEIYQPSAYGDIVEFYSLTDSLDKYFYDTLKPIQVEYDSLERDNELFARDSLLLETIENFKKSIFLLSMKDVSHLAYCAIKKPYTSPIIKESFKFTYDYYKQQLDNHPEMIDDNKQMEEVEGKNEELNEIIELCRKVSIMYNIKLEETKEPE